MTINTDAIALLEKHFDIAFAAPDGVKKLRELILSLAMQGKLVPQDPSDQPASQLLKEIEAEKNRLVKEGKIKQSKSSPLQTKPINFPKGWEFVKLDHVSTKIHYGYTASANHDLKDIRLLRITDIQNNKVDWNSVPGCDIKDKDISQYLLANNDILIARTGGTVGKSYLVENINVKAVFASYLIRVVPSEHIDVSYLKLFIESTLYWEQLYEKCSGTGQPNVNGTSLSTLFLPLPPLTEQRRIVTKIDELMARCDELEKLRGDRDRKQITVHTTALNRLLIAKEQSDFNTTWQFITQHFRELYSVKENVAELRKAILQLAVMGKLVPQDPNDQPASELLKEIKKEKERLVKEGKIKKSKPLPEIKPDEVPYNLPKSWQWVRFGVIVQSMTNGLYKPSQFYSDKGVKIVRMFNIQDGFLDLEKVKRLEVTQEELENYKLSLGDILVNRVNSLELIGKSALLRDKDLQDKLVFEAMNIRVSCFFKETNLPNYANLLLQTINARSYLLGQAKRALGQVSINQPQVSNLLFPLPPLAEQRRIVTKIDQLMALCDNLEKQIERANSKQTNLLNAVMTKI